MKVRLTNGRTDNGTLFLACEPEIRVCATGHVHFGEGVFFDV
jgi:hypothetical protein